MLPAESGAASWLHPAVTVGPSRIAGDGWIATSPIPAGTPVVRTAPAGSPDHAGNHSCEPTVGWADEQTLVTLRDVAAGEELASDYATSDADPDLVLFCHCETYRCRQVIEGTDWQIPQLQARYAGWWAPHVQRLIDAQP